MRPEHKHTNILEQLRKANRDRCNEVFGHEIEEWAPERWATAVSGETGELCNLIKKHFRGDEGITIQMIADEAADIVIYLDLLCQRYGINLSNSIVNKFNEVSKKKDTDITIYYY